MKKPDSKCVLFDLDGTLVDTAPDLAFAANQVRAEAGLPPLPLANYRPVASAGARGLLKVALDFTPEHPEYPQRRDRFLGIYRDNLSRESRLFPEMDETLAAFERRNIRWGVVTNKPQWLAQPLMQDLGLMPRMACLVGQRDGLAIKPAPDSLLQACAELRLKPAECVYVGDDRRDVQAARAAVMPVLAAAWGYIGADESIEDWRADAIVPSPAELPKYCC
jgi:phosphoglycolate phosphatase